MNSTDTHRLFDIISIKRPASVPMQINPNALPFAALSYGMTGEDIALRKFFKNHIQQRKPGFYIDIGCASPFNISNSYLFYCIGWRGLCVDANKDMASTWKSFRGEDIFINVAVGERGGEGFIFRHKTNPGMNRLCETASLPGADYHPTPELIPVMRLDDMFAKHIGEKPIQFMTMDIEGAEFSALRSNDWNRWRPEAIMMECHGFDFNDSYAEPSVRYLADHGYRLDSKIGANVMMIDTTKAA